MGERQVRVRCRDCDRSGWRVGLDREWAPAKVPCERCQGSGLYSATLSDPEVEALIADGEKRREESKALAARIARAFAVGPLEMFPFAPPEDGRGVGG